jgi:uncharacterized RDD family membrane protein YckC
VNVPASAHAPAAASTPPAPAAYAWRRPVPPTAGLRRRAAAFAVDEAIVFLLAWIVTFLAASLHVLRIPDTEVAGTLNAALGLLWIVSIFELPLLLLYFTLFEGLAGRTPGKILLGLRVVRSDERKAGLFEAFLRNLLRLLWVTPFAPIFILLDLWSLRTTELDQRMGDLAAGTLVLDDRLTV